MTLVLDSGGVSRLAASRADVARFRLRYGWPAFVPAAVLVECLTGDHRRDHAANAVLRTCRIIKVEEIHAREASRLRTATGRADTITAVDALVAAMAAALPEPVVLTSDLDDLSALASRARVPITVVPV